MKINVKKLKYPIDTDHCYVHARGVMREDGFGIITMQQLILSGSDLFLGIEMIKTTDGGESFTSPIMCENLKRRYFSDGTSCAMCDATPYYHKKSGKIILTGHEVFYHSSGTQADERTMPLYAVYDEARGDFSEYRRIEIPEEYTDEYYTGGAGCTQICELDSGELLIPMYYITRENASERVMRARSVVLRCTFDGERIVVSEIGDPLSLDVARGLYEPSIIRHGDGFFLSLRNDLTGYVTRSADGLRFDTPRELCFDDGESLGSYNTQSHWLTGDDGLYLVYTRRGAGNDHVFRHRAPLFIAKFDTERMCVVRESECIAVPERGARLGNFGCQSYSGERGYVFAAEWMQCDPLGWDACARYGSDNSIFISEINYK